MKQTGRPPKPTALKKAQGNPGKRPLSDPEPQPDGEARCPLWLCDVAKAEWKRLAPGLRKLGLLTAADQSSFAGYCMAFADWHALVVRTAPDTTQQHLRRSIYAVRGDVLRAMLRAGAEFGLSPSSRTGLSSPTKKAEDDLDSFIKCKPVLKVAKA